MIRRITVPYYLQRGILPNSRGAMNREIFGADTETYKGTPYTFQIAGKDYEKFQRVSPTNITERFFQTLYDDIPHNSRIWFHNLEFDAPVLLYPFIKNFESNAFEMHSSGIWVNVLFGKVNFVIIKIGTKRWELVDSFAFFKTSLEKLGVSLGISLPKMKKPRRLGETRYVGKEWEYFKKYAMRDAALSYHVGLHIEGFHKIYDVKPCISVPQLSAQIFRHKFIPQNSAIPAVPEEIDCASRLSYHGGKSGLYNSPGVYKGVRLYDINSAYPYAMTQLPNFLGASYCEKENPSLTGTLRCGIYKVSGFSSERMYNPLRTHNFEKITGEFKGIWITSYELQTILRHRYVDSLSCEKAYVVFPGRGRNPLREFVNHFYAKKRECKEGDPLREFYKVVLNALYGKFIQNVIIERGDVYTHFDELKDPNVIFRAGGLWNPLIATLITGYVRAWLTELEIRYKALFSSTDSIMTRQRIKTSKELGALSLKAEGDVVLLRQKFYVLWDSKRKIQAYALHGYHGYLPGLLSMLRSGKRTYAHKRMRKVRECAKSKETPLTFATFYKRINLSLTSPIPIPRLTMERNGKTIHL